MQIITDTASLFSTEDGKNMGFTVIANSVILNGEIYRDFQDIDSDTFLDRIKAGGVATTSQPAIGDVLEVLEESGDDVLYLSIGDGLSGAYQNAMGARNSAENKENIHIINTKTLAGPQRYLVKKALQLKEEGLHIDKIIKEIQDCVETSVSFVIPEDFDFLKRSGRLTPIAARIGGLIKIVPVLTQTADKKRIEPFCIKRSKRKAVDAIIGHLHTLGVDENYIISIGHAGACEKAKEILAQIKEQFVNTKTEILSLSPALITHGGPGCITIQAIHK